MRDGVVRHADNQAHVPGFVHRPFGERSVAVVVAEAAATSSAHLVLVNLATLPEDERTVAAEASANVAAHARERALGETP